MSTERTSPVDAATATIGDGVSYVQTKLEVFEGDRLGQIGLVILAVFLFVGIFARPYTLELLDLTIPGLAPHDPTERAVGGRLEGPSADHPFGTTDMGRDVLSQLIAGTRVTLLVGSLAAFMAVFIGTNVGLISAYFGGWVDDTLMRITDVVYGVPFLPFAIVLVAILGSSLFNIILAIVLILWRSTARVIRSQVLSHKQRPYVESAQAIGAGHVRIMYRHILPNVLPLTFLYAAFAVAWAVIAEASLSFLGFGDPDMLSWGEMIYNVYTANAIREAWWWVFPPGIAIMLFVMAVFFIGRTLEKEVNPELQHQ
ncbi:ABC transporter permease [Natronobacterium gregoryi]|uniref:ABC transporter permease n=2 Tax=Natronobacterium gregoryi TaxID=44930 RepID=L0AEN9_NATGS|nr:ABC transporter permease [Natronobacterium gregoryi]AFZ72378.1 ABC-type dipeptide/oligopeptide/nickel transport system, permease component [Natronobacterium gregoryi SP2]ELY64237.1 binding-protein-dependent transport system inner membrane protein [Natronobacterium gregoryi SP2]PLK20308.1 ABC transporter permease [Natronobacterium gregoryi SP2]SFJ21763.1 peptide/nickel transport system permease protein [Natronobacterium gregoryi]